MRLRDYIKAAFNARPAGMFVAPNWVGVAVFGLLGLLNPGFWVLGLGLELGYLYMMSFNGRFRRLVDALGQSRSQRQWQDKQDKLLRQLAPEDQERYMSLAGRCRAILQQQAVDGETAGVAAQGQGLGRLLWIYLRLLLMRQSIARVLRESAGRDTDSRPLDEQIKRLSDRLEKETLSDELRKSLTGQVEILRQRLDGQEQARQKQAFLDAELTRIQEQVELIREQAVLTTDPMAVSQRIDQVAATLGGTTQWIREQQQAYGQVEDLLVEPPPILSPPRQAEGQQQ
ncbi:MAG: hypothetical protein ACE15C_06505 [Phycisphaerae bacterium]